MQGSNPGFLYRMFSRICLVRARSLVEHSLRVCENGELRKMFESKEEEGS
jgi:hypothetical protein